MDLREWIIVLALLLMAVLAVDAWRRVKRQQKFRGNFTAPEFKQRPSSNDIKVKRVAARDERSVAIEERTRKLQLTEKVPMLVDSVEQEAPPEDQSETKETQFAFDLQPPEPVADEADPLLSPTAKDILDDTAPDRTEASDRWRTEDLDQAPYDDDGIEDVHDKPETGRESTPEPTSSLMDDDAEPAWEYDRDVLDTSKVDAAGQQMLAEPDEVIVMTVLAQDSYEFSGTALLEILLACGMRFGTMNIFHATDDEGRLQYSAANAYNPGTFDIDDLEHFATRGVTFFLQLPCQANPMSAFAAMEHAAQTLSEHLHGDLYDDTRSIMTPQTLEHYRERIRNYQRAQLVKRV